MQLSSTVSWLYFRGRQHAEFLFANEWRMNEMIFSHNRCTMYYALADYKKTPRCTRRFSAT
jgi:alpha-ketoglutarate-dependent taurine dioxygenase